MINMLVSHCDNETKLKYTWIYTAWLCYKTSKCVYYEKLQLSKQERFQVKTQFSSNTRNTSYTHKAHHNLQCLLLNKQEAQLMLTNPRDAFRSQSRSPNSSIPYVRYSFLLCNSNFVFKTRRFYDIRLQKM